MPWAERALLRVLARGCVSELPTDMSVPLLYSESRTLFMAMRMGPLLVSKPNKAGPDLPLVSLTCRDQN